MYDNDYLEKILGEQYNMSDYFADTYTDPVVKVIDNESINNSISDNSKLIKNNAELIEENDTKSASNIKKNLKPTTKSEELPQEIEKTQNKKHKTNNSSSNIQEDSKNKYDIKSLYPQIYNAIEPIVELVVKNNSEKEINSDLIESLTNKIYYAIEVDKQPETIAVSTTPINEDETIQASTKPKNKLLHDLIKILLLNNIINNRPPRPLPPPHHPHRPRPILYRDVPFPEDQQY